MVGIFVNVVLPWKHSHSFSYYDKSLQFSQLLLIFVGWMIFYFFVYIHETHITSSVGLMFLAISFISRTQFTNLWLAGNDVIRAAIGLRVCYVIWIAYCLKDGVGTREIKLFSIQLRFYISLVYVYLLYINALKYQQNV